MTGTLNGRVDGRTARRDRNRNEVVEAALALVDEGVMDPSVDQLTERSGLSARSIFRYFDGLDDLRRAVIRSQFERLQPLLDSADAGDGALEARVKRFVDTRLKFNESIAGPARTAQMRAISPPCSRRTSTSSAGSSTRRSAGTSPGSSRAGRRRRRRI